MTSLECSAMPYTIGDYTVNVSVRNSAITPVFNANVRLDFPLFKRDRIFVSVTAIGYLRAEKVIHVQEGQKEYSIDVQLRDIYREFEVLNHNYRPISSVYLVRDQFGFASDHYGIIAYIPKKVWARPNRSGVEIVSSWGLPMLQTCKIESHDDFYKVRLSISRHSLTYSSGVLSIFFKTFDPPDTSAIIAGIEKINEMETSAIATRQQIQKKSAHLLNFFSAEDIEATKVPLPTALQRLIDMQKDFLHLHREL